MRATKIILERVAQPLRLTTTNKDPRDVQHVHLALPLRDAARDFKSTNGNAMHTWATHCLSPYTLMTESVAPTASSTLVGWNAKQVTGPMRAPRKPSK
jgi:hypothetical protein